MGLLQEARSRLVYVQDSPSNIADFLHDFGGLVDKLRDMIPGGKRGSGE